MKMNFFVPDYLHELLTASEQGFDGICQSLSKLISSPVFITDSFYNVLASFPNNKTEFIHPDHSIEQSSVFKCHFSSEESGVGASIKLDNRLRGYIFVLFDCSVKDDSELYQSILSYASSLCTLEFRKRIELRKERQQFKEAFLFDLLYGNIKQKNDIISYGSIWDWDFNYPHTVIVFSLKDFDYYSADQQWMDTLLYLIEKTLLEHNLRPISMKKRDEVIVFYPLFHKELLKNRSDAKDFASGILKQAVKANLKERISLGIGRMYPNPEDLFRSYQEAKVAFELGLLLKIDIPFFSDLGLERILYKHDLQDLKEFYNRTLGELEKYDRLSDSKLMQTLEIYSANQFDLTKASEAMFLHRNTLRYRLKKIEEILDIKLDDMNERLNITASLKIKQLKNI